MVDRLDRAVQQGETIRTKPIASVLTLALAALAALVFTAASATATPITIDSQFTGTLPGQGGVYTIDLSAVAPAFDASHSDTLVVLTGGRGSGGSIWGKYLVGITYGTTPMVEAVKIRNNAVSPNPDGEAVAGIYYLDHPGTATTITISFNGKMDVSGGYTLLALSGAAEGVGATNGTVTGVYPGDTVTSASTSLPETKADSLVIAVAAANRHSPTPVSPLTRFSGGGTTFGAGYQAVAASGTVTPTFSMAAAYTPVVIAAVFEPAVPAPATGGILMVR